MNKFKLKTIISYLFTFFIAFFLYLIVLLTTTHLTIMNPHYFMEKMDEVAYYRNTATEFNHFIKLNVAASGFPQGLFENYIQEEDIREDMIQYEKTMLSANTASISSEKIKTRLQTDINAYIQEKQIIVDPNSQLGIDAFVNTIVDKYIYMTQFPYLDQLGKVQILFHKLYLMGITVLIIVTALLILSIYKLQRHSRIRKRYYAYALIGAGLLTSVFPMILHASRFVEKINLSPEYLYNLLVSFAKSYLIMNMVIGLLLILSGICVTYVKYSFKRKKGDSQKYPQVDIFETFENEEWGQEDET